MIYWGTMFYVMGVAPTLLGITTIKSAWLYLVGSVVTFIGVLLLCLGENNLLYRIKNLEDKIKEREGE